MSSDETPTNGALVFVHLSDLHFRQQGTPLAARDAALRERLQKDILATVKLASGKVEAVLVTGDIARAGLESEYRAAREWLDGLCHKLGIDVTKTLTVPGNHDVNWPRLDSDSDRLGVNADLRSCAKNLIDGKIDDLLKDPDFVLLPVTEYQAFAAAYACDVEKCLAWEIPPIPLGDGYSLTIRGASSVVNSDRSDGRNSMAVQMNQLLTSEVPGIVRMLLIHHDPDFWRRPEPRPSQCGHHIVLYGHVHEARHRLDGPGCLEITAGAVHPEESEEFAIPGYNVIEVSIEQEEPDTSYARVRVFHRNFVREQNAFPEWDATSLIDERIVVPSLGQPDTQMPAVHTASPDTPRETTHVMQDVSGAEEQPPLEASDGSPNPSRVIRAAYEGIGSGDRLRLLREIGIDPAEISTLPVHRQIREVARIVVERDLLNEFHAAVAEITHH